MFYYIEKTVDVSVMINSCHFACPCASVKFLRLDRYCGAKIGRGQLPQDPLSWIQHIGFCSVGDVTSDCLFQKPKHVIHIRVVDRNVPPPFGD